MKCIQYVQSSTYIDVHIHRDPCVYLSLQKQNFKWICINKFKKKTILNKAMIKLATTSSWLDSWLSFMANMSSSTPHRQAMPL